MTHGRNDEDAWKLRPMNGRTLRALRLLVREGLRIVTRSQGQHISRSQQLALQALESASPAVALPTLGPKLAEIRDDASGLGIVLRADTDSGSVQLQRLTRIGGHWLPQRAESFELPAGTQLALTSALLAWRSHRRREERASAARDVVAVGGEQ